MADSARTDSGPDRLGALRRFALAITVITVVGQTVLGFDQAYLQHIVSVLTAYATELILETLRARSEGVRARYLGQGGRGFVDFLLPAHISGLATAFLLFANQRFWPVAFASAVAIGSKYLFRVPAGGRTHHFLNPGNTGILATLVLFPAVSIVSPYTFLANLQGAWDLVVPLVILFTGSIVNYRFTKRLPLIAAWLAAFFLQAVCRWAFLGAELGGTVVAASGPVAFLFSFYMITDPGTSPIKTWSQVAFGAGIGLLYGVFMAFHVVYGLLWALFIVCAVRGLAIYRDGRRTPNLAGGSPIAPQPLT